MSGTSLVMRGRVTWKIRAAVIISRAALELSMLAVKMLPVGSPERIYLEGSNEMRKEAHRKYAEARTGKMLPPSAFLVPLAILMAGAMVAGAIAGFPVIHYLYNHLKG